MQQTKLTSLIETLLNTLIGFGISFIGWPIAAAMTGVNYTHGQHWAIVAFFTVLSIARGYVIRRFFNNGLHLAAANIASKFLQKGETPCQK